MIEETISTNHKKSLSNILLFVVVVVVPTPHTPGCMTYISDRYDQEHFAISR